MQLHVEDRDTWRAWLEAHHDTVREVWLVFFKKHTGVPTVGYDAAVEEAICFGWIDSLIKRLDDDRYLRKFTPRTDTATWSAANLARLERMKAAGRMAPAGLAKIADGVTPAVPPMARVRDVPAYIREALDAHPAARAGFDGLSPSQRRIYLAWIDTAKREDTRRRRLAEALDRLARGLPLGLK